MRKIRYLLTVAVSLIGILIGVFFFVRETFFIPIDYYCTSVQTDWCVVGTLNFVPGYLIGILLTMFFSVLLVTSTSRFFFERTPNIYNYKADYHICNNPFHSEKQETK